MNEIYGKPMQLVWVEVIDMLVRKFIRVNK